MTIWIVTRNGVVDEVFDNQIAALNHQKNLTNRWNITNIVEKELKSL